MPIVEGKTDELRAIEERVDEQVLLQQAAEMDATRVIPVDEMREYSDIKKPEPQEKLLEEAREFNNKRIITDKQRASLERARKAKAEKKRRMEAENTPDNRDAAQGTPVPDYIVNALKDLHTNQEKYFSRLEDLLKVQPYQGPLQPQHIVQSSAPVVVKPPQTANDPHSMNLLPKVEHNQLENPSLQKPEKRYPSSMEYVSPDQDVLEETSRFKRKLNEAFKLMEYYTPEVNKRASLDPNGMGIRPAQQAIQSYSDVYF